MHRVWIGLGSNVSDRLGYLRRALALLAELPGTSLRRVSSVYDTAPVGKTDQARFLNAVAEIETDLAPVELADALLAIEDRCGRFRRERWGPRTLDLDILMYGDLTISDDRLSIPHPRMTERAFVLVPLAEIARGMEVPGTGETVEELLGRVDTSGVIRVDGAPAAGQEDAGQRGARE